MFSRYPIIIRIIAGVLVLTFLSQDIVYANPDCLQIQPLSKGIATGEPDPRAILSARLVQICTPEKPVTALQVVRELKRRKIRLPYNDRGHAFLLNFSRAHFNRHTWVIPCTAQYPGKKRLTYYAIVGEAGLEEVRLGLPSHPGSLIPEQKRAVSPVGKIVPAIHEPVLAPAAVPAEAPHISLKEPGRLRRFLDRIANALEPLKHIRAQPPVTVQWLATPEGMAIPAFGFTMPITMPGAVMSAASKMSGGTDARLPPAKSADDERLLAAFFSDRERIDTMKFWHPSSKKLRRWFVEQLARQRGKENHLFRLNTTDFMTAVAFEMREDGGVKKRNRPLISLLLYYQRILIDAGNAAASLDDAVAELKRDLRIRARHLTAKEAWAEFLSPGTVGKNFWSLTDRKTRGEFIDELARLSGRDKRLLTLTEFSASLFTVGAAEKNLMGLVKCCQDEERAATGREVSDKRAVRLLKKSLGIKDLTPIAGDVCRLAEERALTFERIEEIYLDEVSPTVMAHSARDLLILKLALEHEAWTYAQIARELVRGSEEKALTGARIGQILTRITATVEHALELEKPAIPLARRTRYRWHRPWRIRRA